jgi:hypothetical protein
LSYTEIENFNKEQNEETYNNVKFFIEKNPIEIRKIKKEILIKYPELCNISVAHSGFLMDYIPNELKTLELCKLGLKTDGRAIIFTPKSILEKNPELYSIAVERLPFIISHIPDEIKESNIDLCINAVKGYAPSLLHIPQKIKDKHPELYSYAIALEPKNISKAPLYFLRDNEELLLSCITKDNKISTMLTDDVFEMFPNLMTLKNKR